MTAAGSHNYVVIEQYRDVRCLPPPLSVGLKKWERQMGHWHRFCPAKTNPIIYEGKSMNGIKAIFISIVVVVLAACVPPAATKVTSGTGGATVAVAQAERYDGSKARVAVLDFEDKMSSKHWYRAEYGRGMRDMLSTALFDTNRYIVLEREKLRGVIAEQDLGASGRVKKETAAAIGEIEGAELLLVGAVTGFDPGVSGGTGALAALGAGKLGALLGGVNTARVTIDMRVIDARTSRVVAATSVEGKAAGYAGAGALGGSSLGAGLGGFAKTPMEAAIRKTIEEAVDFVVARTPQDYYRF